MFYRSSSTNRPALATVRESHGSSPRPIKGGFADPSPKLFQGLSDRKPVSTSAQRISDRYLLSINNAKLGLKDPASSPRGWLSTAWLAYCVYLYLFPQANLTSRSNVTERYNDRAIAVLALNFLNIILSTVFLCELAAEIEKYIRTIPEPAQARYVGDRSSYFIGSRFLCRIVGLC